MQKNLFKSILNRMLNQEAYQFYIDQTKETNRIFYTKDSKDIPFEPIDRSQESDLISTIDALADCDSGQGVFTIIKNKSDKYRANVEIIGLR